MSEVVLSASPISTSPEVTITFQSAGGSHWAMAHVSLDEARHLLERLDAAIREIEGRVVIGARKAS